MRNNGHRSQEIKEAQGEGNEAVGKCAARSVQWCRVPLSRSNADKLELDLGRSEWPGCARVVPEGARMGRGQTTLVHLPDRKDSPKTS